MKKEERAEMATKVIAFLKTENVDDKNGRAILGIAWRMLSKKIRTVKK